MERPAELPEIVADLAEMEVVEPLREHVAVAAGLPAVAPVLEERPVRRGAVADHRALVGGERAVPSENIWLRL